MAVISLSFLIIGGIMVACGTKKEVTQSTTENSQDGTFTSIISGYSFELPDSLVFSNSEDTSVGFIQKDGPERNLLSININGYTDDFDLLNESFFKELPSDLWGKDSKEKSFEYYEKGGFKGAYSWYSVKKDEINMDIFNFTCEVKYVSSCTTSKTVKNLLVR